MPRDALRKSHINITLNDNSSKMERRLAKAMDVVLEAVRDKTGLTLVQQKTIYLQEIVDRLNERVGQKVGVTFERAFKMNGNTWLNPDGGFWYVDEWGSDPKRWVLVAEAKRQGTNDARAREGLPKQSRGNAIERLGKNMRGFDAMFIGEAITPFVCFGEGCDFEPESSILDRVATLNGFFPLNHIFVDKIEMPDGYDDVLKPASLYFRRDPWTPREMAEIMTTVCLHAIEYYRNRYNLS